MPEKAIEGESQDESCAPSRAAFSQDQNRESGKLATMVSLGVGWEGEIIREFGIIFKNLKKLQTRCNKSGHLKKVVRKDTGNSKWSRVTNNIEKQANKDEVKRKDKICIKK